MTLRYEKRIVPVEKEVVVVDCHSCGKSADLDDSRREYGKPVEWIGVSESDGFWPFCSKSCLAEWANGQHPTPTNTELTKLAREAFARTSGRT